MTNAEQNRLQGQKLIESGALVVDGSDPAHKIADKVHYGNGSPFREAFDRPRNPQADEHAKAFTPTAQH